MKLKFICKTMMLIGGLFIFNGQTLLFAQSNLKEGNNNFALFTKTGDFKKLELAKKHTDGAYKTSKDSSNYKNNLLRSLVYSSLAVADSNRKLKYSKDPILEAEFALDKLKDADLNYDNQGQITYINKKLARAFLQNADRALSNNEYQKAFDNLNKVDHFSESEIQVKKNLAYLSEKLEKKELAIVHYKDYLKSKDQVSEKNYLLLAKLYRVNNQESEALNTLLTARESFPNDKSILFDIINIYAKNGSYDAVTPLIENAIALDPDNIALNYLAGYAFEVNGNRKKAKYYYHNVISLDENNYSGNLEIGLVYLKDYLEDRKDESRDLAEGYLLKANEINPSALNALKALAVFFRETENTFQYERVQNQISNNSIN